ncbi:MAG: disulfide bond formation protein B [Pseudomonadota bacterium]
MGALNTLLSGWRWPLLAIAASAAMLAAAHGFERFALLYPCPLCLRQREVYWAIVAMTLVGLALWKLRPTPRFLTSLNVLIGLVFLTGAGVAGYHMGVEYGVFPPPAGCGTLSAADAARAALEAGNNLDRPMATSSCTEVPWSMAGISMAGWNMLVSLGLAALSFYAAHRTPMGRTMHSPSTPAIL